MSTALLPHCELDPFSDDLLEDPHELHRELREAGPVVYLDLYDAFAVARYDAVREVMRNWSTFSSAMGTAFNEAKNLKLRGTVLNSDPPEHDSLRAMMLDRLKLSEVKALNELAEHKAMQIVTPLVERGEFDGVTELSEPYVASLVGELVGVSDEILETFVAGSDAGFTTSGPLNRRTIEALPLVEKTLELLHSLTKEDMVPGSMGWYNFEAAEREEIPYEMRLQVLWNYTGPAFHTTINALGNLLWLLAVNPDQWDLLASDRSLIGSAVSESMRVESPIQIWSRGVRERTELEGTLIPEGSRMALFLGAANGDPTHYRDPQRFDIRRNPIDHVSFGHGIHLCVGNHLARTEMAAVLNALLDSRRRPELNGATRRKLNNTTRGFESLPLRFVD